MKNSVTLDILRLGGHVRQVAGRKSFAVETVIGPQVRGWINRAQLDELRRDYLLEQRARWPEVVWDMTAAVKAYLQERDVARGRAMEYVTGARAIWVHKGGERHNHRIACKITGRVSDNNGRPVLILVELEDRHSTTKAIKPFRCIPAVCCPLCEGVGSIDEPTLNQVKACPSCNRAGVVPTDAYPLPGDLPALVVKLTGSAAPAAAT